MTECQDSIIVFPPEVEAAILEVFPSEDPLDQPHFDPVTFINTRLPSEQSLIHLDDVMNEMKNKIQVIDEDMRLIVRSQTALGGQNNASEALEASQASILQLFTQISDIKNKAGESEVLVRQLTSDIKALDTAKKNLTSAMTTLNHLHMLVRGVEQLKVYKNEKQYKEAALMMQGLMGVMEHFNPYSNIPQIKDLSDQVNKIRYEFGVQILNDFTVATNDVNAKHFEANDSARDACALASLLDSQVKFKLIALLLKLTLGEYVIVYKDSWIDKIETRYQWLKKHLLEFEERLGPLFPFDWEMSERLAVEFSDVTRKDLEFLMRKRKGEIDSKLIVFALSKTEAFESLLTQRFTGKTLRAYYIKKQNEKDGNNPFEDEEISDKTNPFYKDPESEKLDLHSISFKGLISRVFEPYLTIYIESQDRNLRDLIDRAALEQKNKGSLHLSTTGSSVLHSCGDLFIFYKKCLSQIGGLSSGESLLDLVRIFKKYLGEYAAKVCVSNFPNIKSSSSSSSSSSLSYLYNKDFSSSSLLQNIQSYLAIKDGDGTTDVKKLSDDDKVLLLSFLVTSEYVLETMEQLEGKLKEKVDPEYVDKICFTAEQDVFHGVIFSVIQFLVRDLETCLRPHLLSMTKVSTNEEGVLDKSPYVSFIISILTDYIPLIRDNLSSSKKYFSQFVVKFVNSFIPNFMSVLYKTRPGSLSENEQLLLDTHYLKALLLELPSLGSKTGKKDPPLSYTKIVIKGMSRAEMTLKVVMSPSESSKDFVSTFNKLLPEATLNELIRVLEMKGIKKNESYIEAFSAEALTHKDSQAILPEEISTIKKIEKLIAKRL